MRPFVDFHHVEPKHAEIHARLENWARWCWDKAASGASPMFQMYRSEARARAQAEAPNVVDILDAAKVQKGVFHLPTPHRLALSWCYIKRSNPRQAAQDVGHSLEGLALLIRDGRTMLVNRGI